MNKTILLAIAALTLGRDAGAQSPAPDAHALVDSSISVMQGRSSLRAAHAMRLAGIQHEWMLGNAERAEGPWRVFYSRFDELLDVTGARLRLTSWALRPDASTAQPRVIVLGDSVVALAGTGLGAASHATLEDLIDRVDGSPDRALLLAAASPALRYDRTVTRYDVGYDVVSFPWRNGRLRIELSRETHLPAAVEIVRPYPDNFRWAPFGDIVMRTDYVDWQVQSWGGWWPMQYKTSLDGEPLRDITLGDAALTPGVAPADSFAVSDSARSTCTTSSTRRTDDGPARRSRPSS